MSPHLRRCAAAFGLACTALTVLVASPARAVPAPVTVTMAEPNAGPNTIFVERTAGETTGAADTWRMNQDIWLRNDGASSLVLESITIAYTGGSDPADITVNAASFDAIADAGDMAPDNQIPAGATRRLKVPEERVHDFPIATSVTVSIGALVAASCVCQLPTALKFSSAKPGGLM